MFKYLVIDIEIVHTYEYHMCVCVSVLLYT